MKRMNVLSVAVMGALTAMSSVVGAADLNEVVVSATKLGVITSSVVDHSTIGAPILLLSLSYKVSTSGLNLVSHAGVVELERRVKATAKEACEELDKQRPLEPPSGPDCQKKAVEDAMVKVHAMTAGAH